MKTIEVASPDPLLNVGAGTGLGARSCVPLIRDARILSAGT